MQILFSKVVLYGTIFFAIEITDKALYYLAKKYLHTSNEGVHFKVMPFLNEKS